LAVRRIQYSIGFINTTYLCGKRDGQGIMNQIEQAAKLLHQLDLPNHPERLVTDILEEKVWDKQVEILQSAFEYDETLVYTGNAVGKTFIGGRLILAFLLAHSPLYGYAEGSTKVVVVGPKFEQIRKQIWGELQAAWYKLGQKIPLGEGRLQAHDLILGPGWYAGIFAVDKENPEKIQGYHAPNFLAIIEEATGVPDVVREAIQGCATSANSHIVAFTNPMRLSGWMYEACTDAKNLELKSKKIRNVIQVSCLDTPNYLLKEDILPGIMSHKVVENRKIEWGTESPMYQARIEGRWPTASDDALIPYEWVESACTEERLAKCMRDEDRRVCAMDIARAGDDLTVMMLLDGDVVSNIRAGRTPNVMKAALMFKEAHSDWGGFAVIDENGLGGGPYDKLKYELNIPVRGWISQRKPDENVKERFCNLKAQIGWELRERFREGTIAIAKGPHRDQLKNDLIGYRVEPDMKGKTKIIDPDRSPDFGDALIMAHWLQKRGASNDEVVSGKKAMSHSIKRVY